MGFVALSFIVGFVGAVIWHRARKLPDWRMVVCRGHGGDAIEKCGRCRGFFCRECHPEGHCVERTCRKEEP